jgi:ribose 5-phosphate isomerase B
MNQMTIGFTNDHAGVEMKRLLLAHLQQRGHVCIDFGVNTTDSADYPDYAHPLGEAIETGAVEVGIALCGTGNGMAITLNRHRNVRAGLAWNADVARLIRQHNNANACVLPVRFITADEATTIVDAYLAATFEGGRHQRRTEKINNFITH